MITKRSKYRYNPTTLSYEKVIIGWSGWLFRVFGILVGLAAIAVVSIVLAFTYIDSPKEKELKREISQLLLQYEILNERLDEVQSVMNELQHRDDNIYRVIFEAEPIPSDVRRAGYGGVNKYKMLENFRNRDVLIETTRRLDVITKQLYVQSKSYDEVMGLIKNKTEMLASIPAIQPISNKDLMRVASGYGMRIHPIYKTNKMHTGMDFTAPSGTEIFATGNGVVLEVDASGRGYGNHVLIDHGYGYQTLYAHLSRFKVRPGQRVNRGQVIGYVGNTGTSTAPHLHYEVHYQGKPVNPINFYYNDLSAEEFERMLEISSRHNQSFD